MARDFIRRFNPPKSGGLFLLSSHIFRHTLVSTLAESNVPLKAIMDRVGHKDARTTSQIYTHVTKSMEQAVLDALDTVALNRK